MKKSLLLLGLSLLMSSLEGYTQSSILYSNTFTDLEGLTLNHINNRAWEQTMTPPEYWFDGAFGSAGFTTANDGYMMFHSASGSFDGLANDATFSFTVDCSNSSSTTLRFQQHFLKYINDITSVIVDDGVNSTTHVLNSTLTTDTYTTNPDDVQLDISSIADGKPNVTITFRYQGNYDYWWLVDDVSVQGNTTVILPIPKVDLFCLAITSISEGTNCDGTKDIAVHVAMDAQPNANTTVNLSLTGTAILGKDYDVNSAEFIFTPSDWDIPQVVTLSVHEDAVLESDETISIDILSVTGSDAIAGINEAITLTIADDERPFAAPTNAIYSNTFSSTDGLAMEHINNTPWIQTMSTPFNWYEPYFGPISFTTVNDGFMLLDSDGAGSDEAAEDASFSFVVDCSNETATVLKFQQHFVKYVNDITSVIVDNGSDSETYVLNSSMGSDSFTANPDHVSIDISAIADGKSDVRITFRYQGDFDYWWMIDDVSVEAGSGANTAIQTSTNMESGYAEHDLAPGAIVHFYDEISGGLMCTIDNSTSTHDYGCTRVEVDRSGTTAEGFINADPGSFMFSKSLKITPTTNTNSDPNGYTIILYYSEEEVSGWEDMTGQSRTSVQVHKVDGDHHISEVTEGNPEGLSITSGNTIYEPFGSAHAFKTSFTNGFSGFGIGVASSALPVELQEFQVRKEAKTSVLKWRTASEKNNKGFHIEKSMNGRDFETIGWVTGAGTTAEIKQYRFVDHNPISGRNYYRLKQEDFDGTISYSEVRTVVFEMEFTATIYPNPSRIGQYTFIELFSERNQKVNIDLFDIQGKWISSFNEILEKGKNKFSLPQENLQAGMYMVSIHHNGGIINQKINIIQ